MLSFCINMKILALIALCAISATGASSNATNAISAKGASSNATDAISAKGASSNATDATTTATTAKEVVLLKIPLHADPRRAAELSCHFNLEKVKLQSVKWYRETQEIFRYVPTQKPPTRKFNTTHLLIENGDCNINFCILQVVLPPISTKAFYTCEVSTEGPRFHISRDTKQMTVVAMPESDPVITGAQRLLKPGDQILLNCTSDFSLPPSEINWYIDDELQTLEPWQKTEIADDKPGGLRRSWRVLQLHVPNTASGILRVKCESILVVDPPVKRETEILITIFSRTELSKYVSNNSGTKIVNNRFVLIASVILLSYKQISRNTSL